jgi:hypothetical protein
VSSIIGVYTSVADLMIEDDACNADMQTALGPAGKEEEMHMHG